MSDKPIRATVAIMALGMGFGLMIGMIAERSDGLNEILGTRKTLVSGPSSPRSHDGPFIGFLAVLGAILGAVGGAFGGAVADGISRQNGKRVENGTKKPV